MKIARSLAEFVTTRALISERVAFVPTMGALHEGHLSLVRLARQYDACVIASLFVNPTQFAEGEDFETYPRDVDTDLALFESAGVDIVFLPTVDDIYPDGPTFDVAPGDAALGLESDDRPAFFNGVVTVVHRFFDIVKPDIAVFGEKDFQQLQVIREMVVAQDQEIQVVGAPTKRDVHGLALSSRNAYLTTDQLEIARGLNGLLFKVAEKLSPPRGGLSGFDHLHEDLKFFDTRPGRFNNSCTPDAAEQFVEEVRILFDAAGFDAIDYVTIRPQWRRVLAAVRIGSTRLIDNCSIPD